jgi:predicted nucleotidyltransferase component of viral defense system
MKEPIKNIAASILARLRNQAEIAERPFAEILQYYAMERLLYRLSKTKYADKFILKGGLLFYVWDLPLRRPTKDIDFRGYGSNNRRDILKVFNTVIAESAPEDGIVFDPQSVSVDETQMDADYQGIRVKVNAFLERTRIPIQIDIGFSDELASKAESIQYPNILPDLKTTHMKGYPKESVVTEKFHAMVRHAALNSRMKDYYDLWLILKTFEFECRSLQKAMETTFKKRDTELPAERPVSLTVEFASVNQTRWINFLQKMKLENVESDSLTDIIEKIWDFLQAPLQASIHKTKSKLKWIPNKGWR